MPNSHATKQLLAEALKEEMNEKPFSKISISDICGKCDMNRQSFYYHFKDKYDLVNWIFDTEVSELGILSETTVSKLLSRLSEYMYENIAFYKKAMSIEGYGSFTEHFRSVVYESGERFIRDNLHIEGEKEFQINLFSDAITLAFKRWLLTFNKMTPSEFMYQLNLCIEYIVKYDENPL